MYVMLSGASIQGMVTAYGDLQKALGSCHRVLQMITDKSQVETAVPTPVATPVPTTFQKDAINVSLKRVIVSDASSVADASKGSIIFRDVHFKYPQREAEVLKGINLRLEPGSTTAVVGLSGSGKSTLVALLLGLYRPSQGQILLGGIPIESQPLSWVRSNIAAVTQDPQLFSMSIRENILYGHLGSKMNGIALQDCLSSTDWDQLLEAAQVKEFLSLMPHHLDTLPGERGDLISGGQRQRISIARALIRKPKFLVLDEATSSLDTISEELVHKGMMEFLPRCTKLMITHRLSSFEHCDDIAVLNEGILEQFGSRESVLLNPGRTLFKILAAHDKGQRNI